MSRNSSSARLRRLLQRESQRLVSNVTQFLQADSLTSCGTSWSGLRFVQDSVVTSDSVCPVLQRYPDVASFVQKVGFNCYEGYGLTETSPLVSANGWMGKGKSRLNTVGMAANGVRVEIDKDAWDDPDRPDEGEVVVYGPNVMQGYWNLPEATAEVMTEDGGFRTGDLGKMVDGYLSITGRVKSQFKLENGKYVSPAPLEENLKLSPLVEQVVLDGKDRKNTFLIVHPSLDALRSAASADGVSVPADNAAM